MKNKSFKSIGKRFTIEIEFIPGSDFQKEFGINTLNTLLQAWQKYLLDSHKKNEVRYWLKTKDCFISVAMVEVIAKYEKTIKKLTDQLNREPTAEEMAKNMGVRLYDIKMLKKIKDKAMNA